MKLFEDNSLYTLRRFYTLAATDRDVLIRLYQPLIGGEALSLYLLFDSLLPACGSAQGRLCDLLTLLESGGSRFLLAREKLEATRLLTTYRREQSGVEEYLFEMQQPLDARTFFAHSLFYPVLRSRVGEGKALNALREHFLLDSQVAGDFLNVTAAFDQVFEMSDIFFSKEEQKNQLEQLAGRSPAAPAAFDQERFAARLAELAPFLSLEDLKAEDLWSVAALAVLYGVPPEVTAQFYFDSLSQRGAFSLDTFTRKIRRYPEHEYEKLDLKAEDVNLFLGDSLDSKKMRNVASVTPAQLIYALTSVAPFEKDLQLLEKLSGEYGLSRPVVNVVIDATYHFCNGTLVANYAERIAASLLYNQIAEPYEAFAHIYQSRQRYTASSHKKDLQQALLGSEVTKAQRRAEASEKSPEPPAEELDSFLKEVQEGL